MAKKAVQRLLEKHPQLVHSENVKVTSHVQRENDEWIENTVMIEDQAVPFKYRRRKKYKTLAGARVNMTYYPNTMLVAGMEFEVMNVVRIKRS